VFVFVHTRTLVTDEIPCQQGFCRIGIAIELKLHPKTSGLYDQELLKDRVEKPVKEQGILSY
jgi:hypothetical protein